MSRFNLFSKKLVDLASESRHASPESPSTHTNTNPTTNTNTNTNPTNPSKLGDNTMFNTVLMPILAKITRIASQRGGEIARPLASELRGFNATPPPPNFRQFLAPNLLLTQSANQGKIKLINLLTQLTNQRILHANQVNLTPQPTPNLRRFRI